MPGIRALHKIYLGQEATPGDLAEVVSAVWRGTGVLDDTRETVFPEETIGQFGGALRSYVPKTGADIPLEGDSTFETLPYVLDAAFYRATPTSDGASSGFVRAYDWQVTQADPIASTDLATVVFEVGDNQRMERARFGFVREFTLSGNASEGWQIAATFETREPLALVSSDNTPSTDVTLPIVETMLFSKTRLYIDPSSDTPGTTEKATTLLTASLDVTTGWVSMFAVSGRTDFSDIKHVGGEGTLEVTFEHNDTANAEIDAWRNQTERVVRLVCVGTPYATTDAGATYDAKTLVIDAFGKWENFEPLGEQDGNNIVTGTLRIGTSSATGQRLVMTVVNEVETLP
jgi:hypothetical protein